MTSLLLDIIGTGNAAAVFDKVTGSAEVLNKKLDTMARKSVNVLVNVDDRGAAEKLGAVNTQAAKTEALGKVVASAFVGTGIALAGAAAVAVTMSAKYETVTTRLVTSAGESASGLNIVSTGMLKLAGQVGIGATELAAGMYVVESAGFHAADGLIVLKAAAEGAKAEGADLKVVANAVTTELIDYHLKADQAANVTSQLVTAVSVGKTNMQDFSGALHAVTPLAASMGITLADVAGALAEMTSHGVGAEQAAQNLAETLRTLQKPSQQSVAALAQVGLTVNDLQSDLKRVGLTGTLESISEAIISKMGPSGQILQNAFNTSKQAADNLATALKVAPPEIQKLASGFLDGTLTLGDYRKELKALPLDQRNLATSFITLNQNAHGFTNALKSGSPQSLNYNQELQAITGNATSMNVALMLTGENIGSTTSSIDKIAGATADASGNVKGFSAVQETLAQKLDVVKASVGSFLIQLGDKLIPYVKSFVDSLTIALPAILSVGGALASIAFNGVADVINAIATAIKFLSDTSNPAILLLDLFAGAAIAVAVGMGIWTAALAVWDIAQTVAIAAMIAWDVVTAPFTLTILAIIAAIALLAFGIIELVKHWKNVVSFFKDVGLAVFDAIKVAIHAVGEAGIWLWDHAIHPAFTAIADAAKVVGGAFKWLWETILHPIFTIFVDIITIAAKVWVAIFVLPTLIAIKLLGLLFTWLWRVAIEPTIHHIAELVHWLWEKGFKPAFDAIGDAVKWVYEKVLLPIWHHLQQDWQTLAALAKWFYEKVLKPVFDAIGIAIKWVYENVLVPIWDHLKQDWKTLSDIALWLWHQVIEPIFHGIGNTIKWVHDNVIKPVFDAIGHAVHAVGQAFQDASDWIGKAWNAVKEAVKGPIRFVVNSVIDPLIQGWDNVVNGVGLGFLAIPLIPKMSAAGGPLTGPGGETDDKIPVWASHNEYIVNAKDAKKNRSILDAINFGHAQFFAGGGNVGNFGPLGWAQNLITSVASLFADPSGAALQVIQQMNSQVPSSIPGADSKGGLSRTLLQMPANLIGGFAKKLKEAIQQFLTSGGGPAGLSLPGNIGGLVATVLEQLGVWSGPRVSAVETRIQHESGGNLNAVNRTDINWQHGTPSVGLMQVIGPTFRSNAGPYLHTGPFLYGVSTNPLANIYAGVHYAMGRYGAGWVNKMTAPGGYANGGIVTHPQVALLGESGHEVVLPLSQPRRVAQLLNQSGLSSHAGGPVELIVTGNVDSAFATALMRLIRDRKIQIRQSQIVAG